MRMSRPGAGITFAVKGLEGGLLTLVNLASGCHTGSKTICVNLRNMAAMAWPSEALVQANIYCAVFHLDAAKILSTA